MQFQDNAKFYFLNSNLGEKRTGIENAALLRARLFKRYLGIEPIIVTSAYNPNIAALRSRFYASGLLDSCTMLINLYEHFQASDGFSSRPEDIVAVRSEDVHISDMLVRRDTYDAFGRLSRSQHFAPGSESPAMEVYYRADGSICLYKYFIHKTEPVMERIQLIDRNGRMAETFDSESGFLAYWISSLTANEKHHFLLIDRERVYYPAIRALKSDRVHIVCMIHSAHYSKKRRAYRSATYQMICEDLSHPDAIVLLTNRQKNDMAQMCGDPGNLFVIPHPCGDSIKEADFSRRIPLRAICLTRYSVEKQHPSLIRAFEKVLRVHPDAVLELYGNGAEKRSIAKLVRTLGLEKNIHINGYAQDVGQIYDSASLSLLASRMEGLSLFQLESIAHGCPIICYDIDYGPDDVVDDGINGYLVDRDDEEAMARRICELFDDPERLRAMSRASYKKAAGFLPQPIADRWAELFLRVLSNKTAKDI